MIFLAKLRTLAAARPHRIDNGLHDYVFRCATFTRLAQMMFSSRILTTSPGRLETAQLHFPNPPCSLTAFTDDYASAKQTLQVVW